MVIEDDAKARTTNRLLGEHEGFEVLLAADGEEGLRLARTQSPDLICSISCFPDLDGIAPEGDARRSEDGPALPITGQDVSKSGSTKA